MLKIDDIAPQIYGEDQFGNKITFDDFKDKKVILFFYPKDNTPGCTAEACDLRDNYKLLLENNFAIVGISVDNIKSHQKFSEKFSFPFSLLSDIDKKIVSDYQVWGEKKFMGRTYLGTNRTTFIISEDRKIENIFTKVETKNHAQQILKQYK